MATWHTVESARDQWPDAPSDFGDSGDDTLLELLAVAREAVLAYAPIPPVTDPPAGPDVIPDGYRAAQLKAARNSWTTARVSQDGFADGGQFGLESQFLPWHQDVRPKRGRPWIG
jgi:hypothetical protein